MLCVHPFELIRKGQDSVILPCGHCVACRMARSREWFVRLWHELLFSSSAVFVTLTYDEEHLPKDYMISKKEAQLFLKRLREVLEGRKIRYYMVGEYGEQLGRPHYHVLLFNVSEKEHVVRRMKGKRARLVLGGPLYLAWKNGGITIGNVDYQSIRYVTDYVQKVLYGEMAKQDGRVQPFALMSLGIGKEYCDKNSEMLRSNMFCWINGHKVGLPKYYVRRLKLEDSLSWQGQNKYENYEEFWKAMEVREKTLIRRKEMQRRMLE